MIGRIALLVALAAGCAKPGVKASPDREVRLLEKGDPALRRIAFAATDYLKATAPAGVDLAFRGVYHKRRIDMELSRDVINAYALADATSGLSSRLPLANVRVFGFTQFRVAYDSAYVETVGFSAGLNCLVLVVKPEGGWGFATMKPTAADACGR